jgi:cell division protease FtsH
LNDLAKNLLLWSIIALLLLLAVRSFGPDSLSGKAPAEVTYSEFMQAVNAGNVVKATIEEDGRKVSFQTGDSVKKFAYGPALHLTLPDLLVAKGVKFDAAKPDSGFSIGSLLVNLLPIALLIGFSVFIMRQMQNGGGGGRGAMNFGKSRARLQGEDQVKVTFADVAGVDEAKEEVKELVDFLRDPAKFQRLGGKIPRGVLMVGQPGTGKTLLAKAIAGEAKVPFFTISGSDFVEMFVGVGASRVRDMFEQAKKHAPCIIFIDEIDAVGRHRGAGLGGGHDEREQTLNQLLVEMDGFEGTEGVILIAATNRPDVLDPALLRPGRFDRQVVVGLPDVRGREQILKVHMKKVPLSADVKPSFLARATPGFSGADLANLVNEAALCAARENSRDVQMKHFEKAKDKILMGAERRSMVMSEEEKRNTAYHESGHAIVGRMVPQHDPVYKVTIIPRGRALGVTMFLPEGDRYSQSKIMLESRLCSLYGGRLAEELIFGAENVTTGASNDIERATSLARSMVSKWGFSDVLGPMTYAEDEQELFLGRSVQQARQISAETAKVLDSEVRSLIDRCYAKARQVLTDNMDKLHAMSAALMKYETIDVGQIDAIMEGRECGPPSDWSQEEIDISNSNSGGGSGGFTPVAQTT